MKRMLESLILGASIVGSTLSAQRRITRPRRIVPTTLAGLPLPTGYAVEVRGAAGETLLLPVCLPPGFELASTTLAEAAEPADGATGDDPATQFFARIRRG